MHSRTLSVCALAVATAAVVGGAAVGDAGPTGAVPRAVQVHESAPSPQTIWTTPPTSGNTLNPAVRDSIRAALGRVRAHDPLPERAPFRQPRDRHRSPAKVAVQYAANGIPAIAVQAYHDAAENIDAELPACHLNWSLLAGIGRIESNHGRFGGAGSAANGEVSPAILGPALTGANGTARITDTDNGEYDGDRKLDRAVGPMQFLPGTWAVVGADGNGDGRADPNNIFDAALGAAEYLCAGDRDLQRPADLHAAVFSYNHSNAYVAEVLGLAALYREGRAPTVPTVSPGRAGTGTGSDSGSGHRPSTHPSKQATHRPAHKSGHHRQGADRPDSNRPGSNRPTPEPSHAPPSGDSPTNPPTSDPPSSSNPPSSNPPTSDPPTSNPPSSDPPPTANPPGAPDRPQLEGSDDPVIAATITPTFTAQVPDSKELLYSFELWPADHDSDDAKVLAGATYRAGAGKPAQWSIPADKPLADGQSYALRVRVRNSSGTSTWSEWLEFTVTVTSGPTDPPTSDPPTGTPTDPPSSGTPTDPPSSDTPTPTPSPSAESSSSADSAEAP